MPGSLSVEEWPGLSYQERLERRRKLYSIPSRLRYELAGPLNYEAQQAPLAYLLLAPVDAALSASPLPVRILLLRIVESAASSLLLYAAALRLGDALELGDRFTDAALLCVFLTQMLWASIAHVGNDSLAIPLTVLFMGSLMYAVKRRSKDLTHLGVILFAGLITKSYFLVFVPVFLGLLLTKHIRALHTWRSIATYIGLPLFAAAPWYLRNLILYRSLLGTQEAAAGTGLLQSLAAVPNINWLSSAAAFARWSIWTSDWSFVSFSRSTLNVLLLLVLAGLLFFFRDYRYTIGAPERWLLIACSVFVVGLIYQTCATWVNTHGASQYPEPWYGQGVLVCVWMLAFRGCKEAGVLGRVVATLLCLVSAWIGIATFLWKLPIFYTTGSSHSNLHAVLAFWSDRPFQLLAPIIIGPVPLWFVALILSVVLTLTAAAECVSKLLQRTTE